MIGHSPGIYQIRCLVNGKIYVGSAVNMTKRWAYHKFTMRKNESCCRILQKAWNKYGEANFIFEVLERVSDREDLIEREQHYLDTLSPFEDRGYNICQKAWSGLGAKRTQETCNKISQAKKGSGSPHYNKGRPVLQFEKTGEFIKEWTAGAFNIQRETGFDAAKIGQCCLSKRKTANGFCWKYKEITDDRVSLGERDPE